MSSVQELEKYFDLSNIYRTGEYNMASPTPSSDTIPSSASNSSEGVDLDGSLNTKCSLCNELYTLPKVLACFHTFCQPCLEKHIESPDRIKCPDCNYETTMSASGVTGLMLDLAVNNVIESSVIDGGAFHCTGCKSRETNAVSRCFDCANFLCPNCVMAHQFMHCFEGHRVRSLAEAKAFGELGIKDEIKAVNCLKHKSEILRFYCKTCDVPICKECTAMEHSKGHEYGFLAEIGQREVDRLHELGEQAKVKANDLRGSAKSIEHSTNKIQVQHQKALNEINDTYNYFRTLLEDRKQEALKELESAYNSKQVSLSTTAQKMQESIERLYQGSDFIEKIVKHTSLPEILMFKKSIDASLQSLISYTPEINSPNASYIEFVSNYQAIQVGIRNTFGYIRQSPDSQQNKQIMPIARPSSYSTRPTTITPPMTNGNGNFFDSTSNLLSSSRYPSSSNVSTTSFSIDPLILSNNSYERWSVGGGDVFQNGEVFPSDPVTEITSRLITANVYPPKSQIKRQKMIYHVKFGEFGVMEGQFTEPSGVAVNAQNDIIVADTNNHRIQIFDKEGRFKFQFGECGKRDGQLLYPNRVAVVKTSGDIIVTERSPTHQVQIYNQYGQFVRKFGANILQHPRGVTVDNMGRIIIVECKVMRVIIFDQMGNVLQKFGCSKHLEFPNGVVVNDNEEIFISDNRAHCVKVFNYKGEYIKQIGGEGITNYPIGVGISNTGEILIADNHNNFNVTIFKQDTTMVSALESKVKHAQCFDVALMDDGSIVLASKDYRLYIYRYLQLQHI